MELYYQEGNEARGGEMGGFVVWQKKQGLWRTSKALRRTFQYKLYYPECIYSSSVGTIYIGIQYTAKQKTMWIYRSQFGNLFTLGRKKMLLPYILLNNCNHNGSLIVFTRTHQTPHAFVIFLHNSKRPLKMIGAQIILLRAFQFHLSI